jgi:hypothetical protein
VILQLKSLKVAGTRREEWNPFREALDKKEREEGL